MKRRGLLGAVAAGVAAAGCTESSGGQTTEPCQVGHTSLSLEPVSLTERQRAHVNPIRFSELSGGTREIFQAVLDGKDVGYCATRSPTTTPERYFGDAKRIVESHIGVQREQYDGPEPPDWLGDTPMWVGQTAYLRADGKLYLVQMGLGDTMVSWGAEPDDDWPRTGTPTRQSPQDT